MDVQLARAAPPVTGCLLNSEIGMAQQTAWLRRDLDVPFSIASRCSQGCIAQTSGVLRLELQPGSSST